MSGPIKDVLLVGFGAVGAIYSLILKRSGLARVTVVARSNFSLVNDEGIHFKSKKYGDIKGWRPDRLCKSVAEAADRPYSYVLVTTKAVPEVIKTSKILAPLLDNEYANKFSQPTYVLVQNGLNVEVELYSAIKALGKGDPSIISSALWIGTNLMAPNVVEHGDFDRLTIGVYRSNDYTTTQNSPEEAGLLKDFGTLLETGGSTITIVPEIQRMKFNKNFWNVAFSSFTTLTQYTVPAIFRGPPADASVSYEPFVSPTTADLISTYTIPAIRATLEELITLGRALGFPDSPEGLPSSVVDRVIESTRVLHIKADSTHVPSMLLDAQKGLPIEVEVIIGEVVRMAKAHNVSVPRIETLYALLLIVQNQILRKIEAGKQ
ncbi:6-phosphogluconate dehydrogenase C-terminal domain-like protein [Pholiota conissans]|uniref:6-phosphogluconate dehydrogenase C-terminal domain-like protein n=1 Tax=Pholiota conissans TaxID=109636 RepID=A0A9P5YV72_9AGAR|nr:6-phosphogluconate dehydrogenase C-terminal domain-like protein [Pholiota conissans]